MGKKTQKSAERSKPEAGKAKPPKGIKVRKLVEGRILYLGNSSEGTVSQEEFSRLSKITFNEKPVIERVKEGRDE